MEGPALFRSFPRTLLRGPIELHAAGKAIRLKEALGNLSVRGLFVSAEDLPVNTAVHVKITADPPFEADGVVRFCGTAGVGIEFTALTEGNRRRLDELIADFAKSETLAS